VGGVGPEIAPDPGSIVVAENPLQIGLLFGLLILVFAVAIARGEAGAQSAAGRVAIAAIFGVLVLALARGWIMVVRRRSRLEVSQNAVTLVRRNGQVSALSRQHGDELRFVNQRGGALGRNFTLGLTMVGTDSVLVLPGFFSRREVRQACRSRGWRVDN
jgi:lysylphosphatidylglycerol synthetase-like protein (DUF2156 family)